MATFKAVNFERYAILEDEELAVAHGFVMVVSSSVLVIRGFVWLRGVLRVGKR